MAINTLREKRIHEIASAIAFEGASRTTIVQRFTKAYNLKKSAIDKLIKLAKVEAETLRKDLQSSETSLAIDGEVEAKKAQLLTALDKRLILMRIMTGQHKNEVKKPVFNPATKKFEIITVHESPNDTAIVRAMAEDNKMVGDYAPEKKNVKHSGSIKDGNQKTLQQIADRMKLNAKK
jgi:hypothetical protein